MIKLEQTINIYSGTSMAAKESIVKTIGRERGKLRNFIRKRVSNREDAEDILQDVFYQFISVMQLDNIEKAASWLFTAASNRITDWYRKKKPLLLEGLKQNPDDDDPFGPVMLGEVLYDPDEDPEKLFLRSSVWPLLSDALQELPDEQREVFLMHELDDLSFKEIAEITGVPVNTLISRKHYAVFFLREKLQDLYREFFYE
jgi:RNA polymerase sigma factor (sigma-70 family)